MAKFKKVHELVPKYNKYRIALMLAYYSFTRNSSPKEVLSLAEDDVFLDNLHKEFLMYLAGKDIVFKEDEEHFKAPDAEINTDKFIHMMDELLKKRI